MPLLQALLSFTESGLSIYWGRKTERHPGRGTFQLLSYYGPNHPQVTPARSSPGGKESPERGQRAHTTCLPLPEPALGECQVEGKEPTHLPRSESQRGKGYETWPGLSSVKLESRVMGDSSARFGEHNCLEITPPLKSLTLSLSAVE